MQLAVYALVAFISMTDQWGGHHNTAQVMQVYDDKQTCEMFKKIEENTLKSRGYTFRCLRHVEWGD